MGSYDHDLESLLTMKWDLMGAYDDDVEQIRLDHDHDLESFIVVIG